MKDVFISFPKQQHTSAMSFYQKLTEDGYSVSLASLERKRDYQLIKESRFFLCLLCEDCLREEEIYQQVCIARFFKKQIYFIPVEDISLFQFKKFRIHKREIEMELPELPKEKELFLEYRTYIRRNQNRKYAMFSIILLTSLFVLFYGFHFFNLKLSNSFGYLFLGFAGGILLSFLSRRWGFLLHAISLTFLLGVSYFCIEPYYLLDISTYPILILILSIFLIYFLYSKKNIVVSFFLSLLYAFFAGILYVGCNFFSLYMYNIDVSFICPVILCIGEIGGYFYSYEHYIYYEDYATIKKQWFKK